jgi:GAF domain-containing protein
MTERDQPLVLVVNGLQEGPCAICEQLAREYRVKEVPTIADAIKILESGETVSLLVTDSQLPDGTGLQMLDETLDFWPPPPVVFMVAKDDDKSVVEALKSGAMDYITKGVTGELRISQILSNVMARSRAERLAQQRAREMGVLNAILTALNRAMFEEPVLSTIVKEVKALMGTEACSIIMMDDKRDQMYLRASTRLPIRDMVLPVPISKSIAGRVAREKEGCITHDVTQDPDWYSLGLEYTVQSMCTVPLLTGGEVIGVLQAINKSVGPFLPTDLALMESIAAVAAAAIERGQQYTALQHMLKKQTDQAAEFEQLGRLILEQVGVIEAGLDSSDTLPALAVLREKAHRLLELSSDE